MSELSIFIDESGDFGTYDISVHTGLIIRREKEYEFMPIEERRRILNSMVTFIRHCNIKYHCIHIDKKHIADSVELSAKLSKKLSEFIAEHTSELVEPECVKIYYDNGQTEVTRILVSVFNALLASEIEFFGNLRDLKKNYLKPLAKFEWK